MYDQDPDLLIWTLNLLCGEQFTNSEYCATIRNYCGLEEENQGADCTLENDELMAHALQQEFSQLTVSELSESSNSDEENLQASLLEYEWFESEGSQIEIDDTEPCSSCSSPEENLYEGESRSLEALELADDFSALDGEVGLRLNQMVPIPHVPKINGDIPSIDEATSDHQRLLDRLSVYDLVEHKVQGDGNCQFRALSDQFYRTTEHHKFVRQQVINQLKSCPDIYEGYVPMTYTEYLKKLSKNGEWGDHVTLQAAADSYGVKIFVITSFKDTCYIEILPNIQMSNRVICLSFWAEVHYNSIYPEGGTDFPVLEETKRKRRWWHFGNKNN